jgi:hypothetical protein
MEKHERQLLASSLPCAAKSFLIYGTESSQADLTSELERLCGPIATLDLPSGSTDAASLRGELKERFDKAPTVLLTVGPKAPEALREVAAEVQRGQLATGDKLAENARLFVFSESLTYAEEDAKPFGIQLVGMRNIKDQRAKVAAAEAELKRRQERARQSSREHGLV